MPMRNGLVWNRASASIALSPTLLADMEGFVHDLGVVGEGASVRGVYLTASSRLCRQSALCLLRRGAAAGGKNYLVAKILMLIPEASVIHLSSGSPLSLVYYGGSDEDALKHKVIYIPEAAALAERNGVESPITFMLRTLISEGRLDHHVTVPQAKGPPIGMHLKRNGPVVVIVTSARQDIEEEMLTRLVTSDADESETQTTAVLADALTKGKRRIDEAKIERWLDFQRWLEMDAPYDVVIPFRASILTAFNKRAAARSEKHIVPLRMRRDVNALILAIETSAILHRAQRKTDAEGKIVATITDYRHAHEAFDAGLAALYRTKIPETALAVVKAAEALGARIEVGAKITISALMAKLGITGRGIASARLKDAEERGFLKLIEPTSGYGRTSARIYELGKTSSEVAELIKTGAQQCVFPSPEEVENEFFLAALP